MLSLEQSMGSKCWLVQMKDRSALTGREEIEEDGEEEMGCVATHSGKMRTVTYLQRKHSAGLFQTFMPGILSGAYVSQGMKIY